MENQKKHFVGVVFALVCWAACLYRCTQQAVPCPSPFDPQSLVCLTSVSASYCPQAWYISRHGWKKGTSAQYRRSCMSTSTVMLR